MSSTPASDFANQSVAWLPEASRVAKSRVMRFIHEHGLADYEALVERANQNPDWFWDAVVKHLELSWTSPYTEVLNLDDGREWPRWFVNGRINYVTNAVDRYIPERSDAVAIRWEGDDGSARNLTFKELSEAVNRCSNALKSLGIDQGDRVGIYLPMLPETAIAMLACGKIGAVFVPIFSGFGADAAATRIADAGVTTLITADGFHRRGRTIELKQTADRAIEIAQTVDTVLVVQHTAHDVDWSPGRDHWWHELVDNADMSCEPADTAASDPFMIIYTSGTTGKPKGAVHTHAGFPIKATQDLAFCFDLQLDNVLCWISDLGWMMGPWAIGGTLIAGGSVMLYEGTPDYPDPDRLWQLIERHSINILGISPTAIRALMALGDDWVAKYEMDSLQAIGSTGEPWNPGPWMWAMEKVGHRRCPIINYSGGTEIGGGIISSTTIQPQKPASFAGPIPGVAADVVDRLGNPVRGEVGELIIRGPWVGMTAGFLDDPDRYLETYWSQIPGVWTHGDWAFIDDDGFWYILGRSDDTMNIAGKRIGPAEIESAAVTHPNVQEAAAVGIPHEVKGETAVVFAILTPGTEATDELATAILEVITDQLGKPLRPDRVVFVADLPRTRNAKIMRRVIKGKYLGRTDLGDLSALENPQAVDAIESTDTIRLTEK